MDNAAWLGLGLGAVVGLIYGIWQAWDMRGGPAGLSGLKFLLAVARMVFLMGALLVAYQYTGADKVWLAVGAGLGFTLVFIVRLTRILAKKK